MTSTQWIVVASLAAVVVSALAIFAGLNSVRDQLRITVFLEYTKRYSKIMQHVPFEAREPGGHYRLASQSESERFRILSVFREYLNMCSEEKWLHDHRRIDHATWRIWVHGMRDAACLPSFRDAWQILYQEYGAYADFQDFVNELISNTLPKDERSRASS